jgi:uncharacterized protein (TIGR02145 family)
MKNNLFKTVTIGDQVWMAENLNVDKFRNGDPIPHAQTVEEWQRAGENGQPAWCYYDNDPANGKIYGKLYNWYAVNDSRGLAPEGWRIPFNEDWDKLFNLLGGSEEAGGKLKATDTTYWESPNTGATNETGFTALPGGIRSSDGTFDGIGKDGRWWCSNEWVENRAELKRMYSNYRNVLWDSSTMDNAISVRCIKD